MRESIMVEEYPRSYTPEEKWITKKAAATVFSASCFFHVQINSITI